MNPSKGLRWLSPYIQAILGPAAFGTFLAVCLYVSGFALSSMYYRQLSIPPDMVGQSQTSYMLLGVAPLVFSIAILSPGILYALLAPSGSRHSVGLEITWRRRWQALLDHSPALLFTLAVLALLLVRTQNRPFWPWLPVPNRPGTVGLLVFLLGFLWLLVREIHRKQRLVSWLLEKKRRHYGPALLVVTSLFVLILLSAALGGQQANAVRQGGRIVSHFDIRMEFVNSSHPLDGKMLVLIAFQGGKYYVIDNQVSASGPISVYVIPEDLVSYVVITRNGGWLA